MWSEQIRIKCKQMAIIMKTNTQQNQISDNINFVLYINTYPLFKQYSILLKNKIGKNINIIPNPNKKKKELTNEISIFGNATKIQLKLF